jgi:hypothetical protein
MREVVQVTGVGRSRQIPDRVVFTLGVESTGSTVSAAMSDNSKRATAIIAALKQRGVKDEEVRTSSLALQPQYEYVEGRRPRIIGYQVTNQVAVTRDRIDDAGTLLQAGVDAGANQIGGVSFVVADPSRGREEGLRAAVADARRRATVLAEAAGRSVGRALTIVEGGQSMPPTPMPSYRMMAAEAASMPVESGSEELEFSVSIVFQLIN